MGLYSMDSLQGLQSFGGFLTPHMQANRADGVSRALQPMANRAKSEAL